MRYVIDPGRTRKSVNMTDNICYSHVTDLEGRPLDLYLSICAKDGNSEMRLAMGRDDEPPMDPMPCIVWVPGGGWRGSDKNLMVPEMQFLVERGYVLASIYYRSSAQGHWPDQIVDVKTAIRFLRAHAETYHIDPERIGIMGRSAGGHLASMAAMNLDSAPPAQWAAYSDKVQAACDLFGPVELPSLIAHDRKRGHGGGSAGGAGQLRYHPWDHGLRDPQQHGGGAAGRERHRPAGVFGQERLPVRRHHRLLPPQTP